MNVYMTEDEQLAAIKNFFKQYGATILVAFIIAMMIFLGWRYWNQRSEKLGQIASVNYEQMLQSEMSGDDEATTLQANYIISQYPQTPYASQASLLLAKIAVKNNQYDEANKNLRWIIDHNKVGALKQIAALRLARILIQQNHAQEALTQMNNIYDPQFIAAIEEVKGDAYQVLKDPKKAYAAYQQSLAHLPENVAHRKSLEMKLANVSE